MVSESKGNLFIVGDLFDYWANNRSLMNDHFAVFDALAKLKGNAERVGFLIGNRDLLLGKKVLSSYGIEYLGESSQLELEGRRFFLTHGHLLCTDDIQFQHYRRTKWPIYRVLDAVLPGFIENYLAERFITKSKQVIESQEPWRFQFSHEAIEEKFSQGNEIIVCGHSHQAMIEKYDGEKYFVVLPSWTDTKGGFLSFEEGRLQMREFPDDQ
jgi:UDP-2,3-diacylglucosamine hydrolase